MASTITDTHRRIVVSDVRDVIVTSIVEADGSFTRAIRILGEPVTGGNATEIIEIKLVSGERADIEFSAPTFEF